MANEIPFQQPFEFKLNYANAVEAFPPLKLSATAFAHGSLSRTGELGRRWPIEDGLVLVIKAAARTIVQECFKRFWNSTDLSSQIGGRIDTGNVCRMDGGWLASLCAMLVLTSKQFRRRTE